VPGGTGTGRVGEKTQGVAGRCKRATTQSGSTKVQDMTSGGIRRSLMAAASLALASFGGVAHADPHPWQLNMEPGASTWSHVPYDLNNISLAVCVVIGILVFGAMFVADRQRDVVQVVGHMRPGT